MGNKEIASNFNLLAALMELHGENAFKIKAYTSAFQSLRKWDRPLSEMSDAEIAAIPGIGASTSAKIRSFLTTGSIEQLDKLKAITPVGIQQLLSIKGLGPKKIRTIWDELGVETPAELLYACTENRLVRLSGFGIRTQEDLQNKIAYFLDSQDRCLYGTVEPELNQFITLMKKEFPAHRIEWVGEVARKCPVINSIECLIGPPLSMNEDSRIEPLEFIQKNDDQSILLRFDGRIKIHCFYAEENNYSQTWSRLTMNGPLYEKISQYINPGSSVDEILIKHGFENLPVELMDREGIENADASAWKNLVTSADIKGALHNHSTWSDGIHSLEEMAMHVRDQGYEYFGITDHSRSAFYANGLQPERVLAQMEEIDKLNAKLTPFKIFKGIESDILGNGGLDYEDDILSKFDFIVASIHSQLRMDEEKATARLIGAIENPYTRILGHPTSRLLLARPGYPIDYRKVIDACAANRVVMELNSNPQRMDIDYAWLEYCQQKGVMVSINPDAHNKSQIGYIRFGVYSARKGMLMKENCLNAMPLDAFQQWIKQ